MKWLMGLLLLLGGALIVLLDFDLSVAHGFYRDGDWVFHDDWMANWVRAYGDLPIYYVGVALLVYLGVAYSFKLTINRARVWFLIVYIAVIPGLLVNGVFKLGLERPRPRDVSQFGGVAEFQPMTEVLMYWNWAQRHQSFPSGHAAAAFAFMAPYFVFRGRYRYWGRVALIVGLIYGCVVSYYRMALAGHFLSDVYGALLISYWGGLLLSLLWKSSRDIR